MKLLLAIILLSSFLFHSAYACGMGGIGAPTSGAVIALCVVFLPVIIPTVIVGGTGYLAYSGIKKGARQVKYAKKARDRKRNSDIIKTQMSRAVKLVGKDAFERHIQDLYSKAKPDNGKEGNLRATFELGVALFLSRDLIGADQYLSEVIRRGYAVGFMPHCYFVRGLVNQYLFAFEQASEDFLEAIKLFERVNPDDQALSLATDGIDPEKVPRLSALDAHNSYGFVCQLRALYEDMSDAERVRLLTIAITEYTTALDNVPIKQGMWFHNRGVARYFRTYYQTDVQPDAVKHQIELSLEDFINAINSNNFGTAADGHAMAAQACARLKRPMDEIQRYIDQAYDADPKVFMVDVTDEVELSIPWPLPRHEYPFKKSPHNFEKVHFNKPTWCDHCMLFVQNPVGKQGYQCTKCKYNVHSKCFPQVKAKSCWSEEREVASTEIQNSQGGVASPHTHHFKAVHFNKPTWCDHCKKFVASPIGKQGYRCSDCKMQIHKDCVDLVKPSLVQE